MCIQRTVCRAAVFFLLHKVLTDRSFCMVDEKGNRKNDSVLRFNGSYGSYHYSFRCTRLSARIYSFPIIEKISTIPFLTFSFRKKCWRLKMLFKFLRKNTPLAGGVGISRINSTDSCICQIPYRIASDLFRQKCTGNKLTAKSLFFISFVHSKIANKIRFYHHVPYDYIRVRNVKCENLKSQETSF